MVDQKKPRTLLKSLLLIAGLLSSCNLPGSATPTEISPDAVYTMAAETVMAHYTAEAVEPPLLEERPTDSTPIIPTETQTSPELTITAEPSITPTETETPTQTKIPEAILEDNFSNKTLWYVAEEDQFGFEYEDGGYRIYNDILNGTIWSIKFLEYTDIRVEVDATRLNGPDDGYYGVVCRFQDDGENYYALVINDSGFYGILKMVEGESEFLVTGVDENNIINSDGEVNRVQGVCDGELLSLYANDELLVEVDDGTILEGIVGLVVGNQLSGVGIDVLFDNFVLLAP
jgi:hypothetical protein